MNKNALLFIGIALAIAVGLFLLLKPADTAPATAATVAAASLKAPDAVTATAVPVPVPQVFDIGVRGGQRVSGPAQIRVQVGDDVVLRVTSDHDDELHLHGYDLLLALHANVPGELRFKAVHSGHFDYELHHADLELGALDVMPQ
ncbi:MAG: hypothetical protein ACRESS_02715 [Stenotrophobium sp.]